MVALAPITNENPTWDVLDTFPKLHSRAREVKTRHCTEAPRSKSRSGVEIWLMIYESCDGLESFTRDPIGLADGENLYQYVGSNPLIRLDPSGNVSIECTCAHRYGEADQETVIVDCTGSGDNCCRSACDELHRPFWPGNWKIVDADPDDTGLDDEVIDIAGDVVCSFFLVCDVVTWPVPGDGAACAVGTRVVCKQLKKCVKISKGPPKKTPKNPRCLALKLAKELACGLAGGSGGCGDPPNFAGLSGGECHKRELLWSGCAVARESFQKACFKKGDPGWPGHIQQIGQAKAAARKCGQCAATRP